MLIKDSPRKSLNLERKANKYFKIKNRNKMEFTSLNIS